MVSLDEFSFMEPYAFYDQDIDVIYGLYSRHGRFHGKQYRVLTCLVRITLEFLEL